MDTRPAAMARPQHGPWTPPPPSMTWQQEESWNAMMLDWWREKHGRNQQPWYYGYGEAELRRFMRMRGRRIVAGWERLRHYSERSHAKLEGSPKVASLEQGNNNTAALVLVVLMALMFLVQLSERCLERIMKRRRGSSSSCRDARELSVRWDPEQTSQVGGLLPTIEDISLSPSPPPYAPPPQYPGPPAPKPADAPPAYDGLVVAGGPVARDCGDKPEADEPPPPYSACYVALKDKDAFPSLEVVWEDGGCSSSAVLEVTMIGGGPGPVEPADTRV